MRAALSEVDSLGPARGLGREYEPGELVAARAELRGPSRRRAGADVHGDGRIEAWTGWIRRRVLEPRGGETPWDALEREVTGG